MVNKWYWTYKHVLIGPALHVFNRPWAEGMDNIPAEGPAIVASSHQSVMDSFFFPLMCPRQITFLAKAEYFNSPGLKGKLKRFFFTSLNQVPVERDAESAAEGMLIAAKRVLAQGKVFGIYPEGTRSPDGRVYKGRTGMARVAMETGAPVIPVGMIDTNKANPIGTVVPRPVKVGMRVGEAIDPHAWAAERGLDPADHKTIREFTNYVMDLLSQLTGKPYVNMYASEVKNSLNAGLGYPAGAELDSEGA